MTPAAANAIPKISPDTVTRHAVGKRKSPRGPRLSRLSTQRQSNSASSASAVGELQTDRVQRKTSPLLLHRCCLKPRQDRVRSKQLVQESSGPYPAGERVWHP